MSVRASARVRASAPVVTYRSHWRIAPHEGGASPLTLIPADDEPEPQSAVIDVDAELLELSSRPRDARPTLPPSMQNSPRPTEDKTEFDKIWGVWKAKLGVLVENVLETEAKIRETTAAVANMAQAAATAALKEHWHNAAQRNLHLLTCYDYMVQWALSYEIDTLHNDYYALDIEHLKEALKFATTEIPQADYTPRENPWGTPRVHGLGGAEWTAGTLVTTNRYATRATVGASYGSYARDLYRPLAFTDKLIPEVRARVLHRELVDISAAGGAEGLVVHYNVGKMEDILSDPLHSIAWESPQESAGAGADRPFARVMFFTVNKHSTDLIDVGKLPGFDLLFARPTAAEAALMKQEDFSNMALLDNVVLVGAASEHKPEERRKIPPLMYQPPDVEMLPSLQLTDDVLTTAPGWFACVKSEPLHVSVGHGVHAEYADFRVLRSLEGTLPQTRFKCRLAGAAFADAVLPPMEE